jgi:hypothetical protein
MTSFTQFDQISLIILEIGSFHLFTHRLTDDVMYFGVALGFTYPTFSSLRKSEIYRHGLDVQFFRVLRFSGNEGPINLASLVSFLPFAEQAQEYPAVAGWVLLTSPTFDAPLLFL